LLRHRSLKAGRPDYEEVQAAAPVAGVLSGRDERKAIDLPSGLQRGEFEDCGAVVNCQGARLPSMAVIQIEELRRFCVLSIFVTT
jgi:hypothetical protein